MLKSTTQGPVADLVLLRPSLGRSRDSGPIRREISPPVNSSKDNVETLYDRANAFRENGQLDEAIVAYSRAHDLEPRSSEILNNLGDAFRARGRIGEAIVACRSAIQLRPDFAEAHNNLGNALRDQGKFDEAIVAYTRAAHLRPDVHSIHNNLGIVLSIQGRLDEAMVSYATAIRLKPDYAKAHNNLGSVLRDKGRPDEAVRACRRAIELRPDFAQAYNNLGCALSSMGRFGDAVGAFTRALEIQPQLAGVHHHLADAYRQTGQLANAITAYRRAIQIKPSDGILYCNLGHALKDSGRIDEAIGAYIDSIQRKPDSVEPYFNLGNSLRDKGQYEQAADVYRDALKLRPNLATVHNHLGVVLNLSGKVDQAIEAFATAVTLKPDYAKAYNNLGAALRDQGRFDDAVAACHSATVLKPDYAMGHYNLGKALKDVGRLDDAIAAYRAAIRLQPNLAEAHNNLANAYKERGQLDDAIASYTRAIELKPGMAQAQSNLESARQEKKQLDRHSEIETAISEPEPVLPYAIEEIPFAGEGIAPAAEVENVVDAAPVETIPAVEPDLSVLPDLLVRTDRPAEPGNSVTDDKLEESRSAVVDIQPVEISDSVEPLSSNHFEPMLAPNDAVAAREGARHDDHPLASPILFDPPQGRLVESSAIDELSSLSEPTEDPRNALMAEVSDVSEVFIPSGVDFGTELGEVDLLTFADEADERPLPPVLTTSDWELNLPAGEESKQKAVSEVEPVIDSKAGEPDSVFFENAVGPQTMTSLEQAPSIHNAPNLADLIDISAPVEGNEREKAVEREAIAEVMPVVVAEAEPEDDSLAIELIPGSEANSATTIDAPSSESTAAREPVVPESAAEQSASDPIVAEAIAPDPMPAAQMPAMQNPASGSSAQIDMPLAARDVMSDRIDSGGSTELWDAGASVLTVDSTVTGSQTLDVPASVDDSPVVELRGAETVTCAHSFSNVESPVCPLETPDGVTGTSVLVSVDLPATDDSGDLESGFVEGHVVDPPVRIQSIFLPDGGQRPGDPDHALRITANSAETVVRHRPALKEDSAVPELLRTKPERQTKAHKSSLRRKNRAGSKSRFGASALEMDQGAESEGGGGAVLTLTAPIDRGTFAEPASTKTPSVDIVVEELPWAIGRTQFAQDAVDASNKLNWDGVEFAPTDFAIKRCERIEMAPVRIPASTPGETPVAIAVVQTQAGWEVRDMAKGQESADVAGSVVTLTAPIDGGTIDEAASVSGASEPITSHGAGMLAPQSVDTLETIAPLLASIAEPHGGVANDIIVQVPSVDGADISAAVDIVSDSTPVLPVDIVIVVSAATVERSAPATLDQPPPAQVDSLPVLSPMNVFEGVEMVAAPVSIQTPDIYRDGLPPIEPAVVDPIPAAETADIARQAEDAKLFAGNDVDADTNAGCELTPLPDHDLVPASGLTIDASSAIPALGIVTSFTSSLDWEPSLWAELLTLDRIDVETSFSQDLQTGFPAADSAIVESVLTVAMPPEIADTVREEPNSVLLPIGNQPVLEEPVVHEVTEVEPTSFAEQERIDTSNALGEAVPSALQNVSQPEPFDAHVDAGHVPEIEQQWNDVTEVAIEEPTFEEVVNAPRPLNQHLMDEVVLAVEPLAAEIIESPESVTAQVDDLPTLSVSPPARELRATVDTNERETLHSEAPLIVEVIPVEVPDVSDEAISKLVDDIEPLSGTFEVSTADIPALSVTPVIEEPAAVGHVNMDETSEAEPYSIALESVDDLEAFDGPTPQATDSAEPSPEFADTRAENGTTFESTSSAYKEPAPGELPQNFAALEASALGDDIYELVTPAAPDPEPKRPPVRPSVARPQPVVETSFPQAMIQYNLAGQCLAAGKLDRTIACYRRALELSPDFDDARRELAKALKEKRQLADAVMTHEVAVSLYPRDADAYCKLAEAQQKNEQFSEAVGSYQIAVRLRPDSAEAFCKLGNALRDLGRRDEAREAYRRALSLRAHFREAHDNLLDLAFNR